MLHKILSLFALLTFAVVSSQTIPRTDNICFFQDAKSGKPITIVNDSLVYEGELKNPIKLKHTDYPDVLKNYTYHFNIKQHTYLVHVGCGPVLEYRNDSIVRIDNSFLQRNQYEAAPFVYNNQICLFGGYGFFSFKNMITYYNFKSSEWLRLYEKNSEKPQERISSLHFYNSKGFYLFGGWTDNNSIYQTYIDDSSLWYFDYETLQWQRLGNYNKYLNKKLPEIYFQTENRLYLITTSNIIAIDFLNNNVQWFKNNNLISFHNIFLDKKTNSLYYLANIFGGDKQIVDKTSLTQLLKYPIKTEKLYFSPWQELVIPSLWIFLSLILIFVVYKLIVRQKENCFVYYQSKNKLYYRSKIIFNLDPLEKKILIYLFQNNKDFIQLNQLNSFFEKESPDNFFNVIKKRDLVFSSLLVKLNAIAKQKEKPLVLLQKNEMDKRIKEIRLNPLSFFIK